MTRRRAIVVGSEGQDGRLMFDALAAEGRDVLGVGRAGTRRGDGTRGPAVDVLNPGAVADLVGRERPDEVYFLAAVHGSSQDATTAGPAELLRASLAVNAAAPLNFLEALRTVAPQGRLFYAASCHVFGTDPVTVPQDERTPLDPRSAYAISKAAGLHTCRLYREQHGVFAAGGILYNHESRYRREEYVSQKIARAAARLKRGERRQPLVLGDLSAQVDWGHAADTVDAMRRIVRLDRPDDFVVATGESHSVADFAAAAFGAVGLDWREHVTEDPAVIIRRPSRLLGNAARLRAATGWRPTIGFGQMVAGMVRDALTAEVPGE